VASFDEELANRVRGALDQLTPNDRTVINYLRMHPEELVFATVEDIASRIGISAAAVVRTAKRLGYAGTGDLRDRVRAEWKGRGGAPHTHFDESASPRIRERVEEAASAVARSAQLNEEMIAEAGGLLDAADRVFTIGHRKTYALAVYAHRLIHSVRPDVFLVDPGFPDSPARLASSDVIMAFTVPRYSRQTSAALARFRAAGARVIVVTDTLGMTMASPADVVLACQTQTNTFYQSHVALVAVLELVVDDLAARSPRRTKAYLARTEAFSAAGMVLHDNDLADDDRGQPDHARWVSDGDVAGQQESEDQ
jgi:DNA-binding MurR/RpiR family transcriptional regulator